MTSTLTPPATDTATPAQARTTLGTVLVTGGSSGLGAATGPGRAALSAVVRGAVVPLTPVTPPAGSRPPAGPWTAR